MARVTVEDCILTVPNRFELVLLASKRSREISAGAPLTVARDNDKNPVVSLREISENSIDIEVLRENLVRGMQRHVFVEDHETDIEREVTDALDDDSEGDDFDAALMGAEAVQGLSEIADSDDLLGGDSVVFADIDDEDAGETGDESSDDVDDE